LRVEGLPPVVGGPPHDEAISMRDINISTVSFRKEKRIKKLLHVATKHPSGANDDLCF
jgi:hypothetical protein